MNATAAAPTNVYNHILLISPDNVADAKNLIGFIAAPEINENRKISNPTIAPDAIHPNPFNPLVCTDVNIIVIKNAVTIISTAKTSKMG